MNASRDFAHGRIELLVGNIVEQDVDAIVNAANTTLEGGGGVDGAIHRAAGPSLLEECLKLPQYEPGRRCPTGECRVTGGGNLKARYVIHAVGPVYNDRSAEKAREQLRQVHRNSLQAAAEHDCRSIAFPAISTGAYRFPIEEAAPIALGVVREFLEAPSSVQLVRFVLFSQPPFDAFEKALGKV
ncbi:MAG: O-acetyl-ADP-ribose deacetylase [Planctomycetes bacterium]|nr:O-acetyl-ADP-ribose deacetylase [Planctomycetota bacterium]